jgi:hypothetical protein
MLLAEAVKEKEYYRDMIASLTKHLKNYSIAPREQVAQYKRDIVIKQLESLEASFKEYQKYCILIARSESRVVIKLNDEDFSLLDAEQLLISLKNKLAVFIDLLDNASSELNIHGGVMCLDENRLLEKITKLRVDIKTIESSIEKVMWSFEI